MFDKPEFLGEVGSARVTFTCDNEGCDESVGVTVLRKEIDDSKRSGATDAFAVVSAAAKRLEERFGWEVIKEAGCEHGHKNHLCPKCRAKA